MGSFLLHLEMVDKMWQPEITIYESINSASGNHEGGTI